MDGKEVGPGPRKGLHEFFRVFNHQVNIQEDLSLSAERSHNDRPDRDVGDKMAVHDIDLDGFGPRSLDHANVSGQIAKVSGQNRGDDLRRHFTSCSSTMMPLTK